MKGKTTIQLSRDNVKDIITAAVKDMVGDVEVHNIEVHRAGAIDVTFSKQAPTLPLTGEGDASGS